MTIWYEGVEFRCQCCQIPDDGDLLGMRRQWHGGFTNILQTEALLEAVLREVEVRLPNIAL